MNEWTEVNEFNLLEQQYDRANNASGRDKRAPVSCIGGEGRSGSTVLSAILGNRRGYLPIGELPDAWLALYGYAWLLWPRPYNANDNHNGKLGGTFPHA